MKLLKEACLSTLLMFGFGVSHAQVNAEFSETFSKCMAQPNASVFTCAESADRATQTSKLAVTREITRDPSGRPALRKHVEVCSDDGYEICDHYDCDEDEGKFQTICKFVGTTCGEYWCN